MPYHYIFFSLTKRPFLFLVLLTSFSFSTPSYSEGGFEFGYQLPGIPLEFTFDENGMKISGSKTVVTPIGSFSLGYSKYKVKYYREYTYVIIEDLVNSKEHIYKVKDKQTLKLLNKGITNIEINKNKIKIKIGKNSNFKVSFKVEDETKHVISNETLIIDRLMWQNEKYTDSDKKRFHMYIRNIINNKPINEDLSKLTAQYNCDRLRLGGNYDWRVPTQAEIISLAGGEINIVTSVEDDIDTLDKEGVFPKEFDRSNPAHRNFYREKLTEIYENGHIKTMFGYGYGNNKPDIFSMRCVRDIY